MKRIIITTDFSCHSKHTIQYVLDLLQDTQIPCKILLLNTFMVQKTDPEHVILVNDELKKKSRHSLEQEREEALKIINNQNISIETASHMGSLNNVVLNLLRKENIDLVAMGNDSGKHVEVMSNLLKQHKCPLLITYFKDR